MNQESILLHRLFTGPSNSSPDPARSPVVLKTTKVPSDQETLSAGAASGQISLHAGEIASDLSIPAFLRPEIQRDGAQFINGWDRATVSRQVYRL